MGRIGVGHLGLGTDSQDSTGLVTDEKEIGPIDIDQWFELCREKFLYPKEADQRGLHFEGERAKFYWLCQIINFPTISSSQSSHFMFP